MKTYKSIERKSIILGMAVGDLMLLLCLLIVLVLLGGITGTFLPVSKYYYLCSLLSVTALQFILRYLNRRGHPTFLASRISYYFLQARRINITSKSFYHGKSTPPGKGKKLLPGSADARLCRGGAAAGPAGRAPGAGL